MFVLLVSDSSQLLRLAGRRVDKSHRIRLHAIFRRALYLGSRYSRNVRTLTNPGSLPQGQIKILFIGLVRFRRFA